jgi:hypothetical protein
MVAIDTFTLGYSIAGILVFLLWYTLLSSRLFGFIISIILRVFLGEKVVCDVKGIHIALLTGRVYFRGLTYVTPNAALFVLDGTFRFFWWRSLLMFSASEKENDDSCLISVSLNGLEYTIANNSNRRELIERIMSMRNSQTPVAVAVDHSAVAPTLPFLFEISPRISVDVHRGVISIGNDVALSETSIVIYFDSANSIIRTEASTYVYTLVVSARLNQLSIREQRPMLSSPAVKSQKPSPVAPVRVAPEDVFSLDFKAQHRWNTQSAAAASGAPSTRPSPFLDVDSVATFRRNVVQLGTQAIELLEGAGAKLLKLDEHLLNFLGSESAQAKMPHSTAGNHGTVILQCSKLFIQYHQECDGVASDDSCPAPLWKIELDFVSSFVRYGPVEHSIRTIISRFFLPWTYEPQVVKQVVKDKLRGFDSLIVDIRFREVVDALIPFNAVKSSFYPELHVDLPKQFLRKASNEDKSSSGVKCMGWLHLKCGDGVPLANIEFQHDMHAEVSFVHSHSKFICLSFSLAICQISLLTQVFRLRGLILSPSLKPTMKLIPSTRTSPSFYPPPNPA